VGLIDKVVHSVHSEHTSFGQFGHFNFLPNCIVLPFGNTFLKLWVN
jgi:hypothetical protein